MKLIDTCKLELKAGDGGDGIVSWRRETHVPLGGPSGGNGGCGGDIILVGDHNETSLQYLQYTKIIKVKQGERGGIKKCSGHASENKYLRVPIGTVVFDDTTNEEIIDITKHKQEYIISHGGKGGKGNAHFMSRNNTAPKMFELGDIGEHKFIRLDLKYLADIGLVGLPNAGKSTLISKISNAKPKTAAYQFTTLTPILGTIYDKNQRIVYADIPGLIEGASEGYGLGHEFLKHIERCKVLIHLISLSKTDNEDIVKAYQIIIDELKKYSKQLANKPILVVANKSDTEGSQEQYKKLKAYLKRDILTISALDEIGLDEFKKQSIEMFYNEKIRIEEELLEQEKNQPTTIKYIEPETKYNKNVVISQINEYTWNVECEFLKYWSHKIPLTTQDNLIRFNQKMGTVDCEKKLKLAGAKVKDKIIIYNIEFNFED